jgi:hypothetical protein
MEDATMKEDNKTTKTKEKTRQFRQLITVFGTFPSKDYLEKIIAGATYI